MKTTLLKRLSQDLTEYQSIPFWSWNDELEPEELRRQIRLMKKAGIGGFFMHARGGLTTEYMGEDWFKAVDACIDEAGKQGMGAWCYDENGWPSGFAGMKLLEDPENLEHYIVFEKKAAFDPDALAVYVLEEKGEDLPVLRRIFGEEPGTESYLTVYQRTNSSVVDILNPAIVRKFLDLTHEEYYRRFGDRFGDPMLGFFTDEPQYFRWDTAYTPCILPLYRERYGEELLDRLGSLFVKCQGTYAFRFRYWSLMNEMYMDSFARQISDWCREHNCMFTGHSIEENGLFGQLVCCGGVMPFYKYEQMPGMDWLGRGIASEQAPKQVASVSQQYGKKHVMTETFACAGWDVTPKELKRIAEWQYVNGVNLMCQHLYPYSIHGQRKRDYPAFYSEHNSWTGTEDFKRFNDYFTALGYMLSESRELADVAVIHPLHACYLEYDRRDRRSLKKHTDRFVRLIEKLGAAQIGHHYLDEKLLREDGRVEGASIVMGQCTYTKIVLPVMETLDRSTADFLRQYMENGGKLYMEGPAPTMIDGEPADLSFLKSNLTFAKLQQKEYKIDRKDSAVRSTYRVADFGTFLYAVNLSEDKTEEVTYTLKGTGAELFDLETRSFRPLHYEKKGRSIEIRWSFEPGESHIFFLKKGTEPAPAKSLPEEARMLPLTGRILSMTENTWTLDKASLSLNGRQFTGPLHVMAISDRLLRGKKNRKVWLKYEFTVEQVPEKLRLECEDMGNRQVLLNGQELVLRREEPGVCLDPSFLNAEISDRIRAGKNELIFCIDYYQPEEVYRIFNGIYYEHSDGTESLLNCLSYRTDIEAVYLRGDFSLKAGEYCKAERNTLITGDPFVMVLPKKELDAGTVTREGYPFFGGFMELEFNFDAEGNEQELWLQGRFPMAKISLNGGEEKVLLFDHRADVSGDIRPGRNVLRLKLYSSYRNLFGPFHQEGDPEPLSVSPRVFSLYGTWRKNGTSKLYRDSYSFVNFGIDSMTLR